MPQHSTVHTAMQTTSWQMGCQSTRQPDRSDDLTGLRSSHSWKTRLLRHLFPNLSNIYTCVCLTERRHKQLRGHLIGKTQGKHNLDMQISTQVLTIEKQMEQSVCESENAK